MLKHFIKTILFCGVLLPTIQAQEVNYDRVDFKYAIPATMPELQNYKTFDLTFSNEMESLFKKDKDGNLNFQPAFGSLKQVPSSEDLHVFCSLYYLKLGTDGNKNPVYEIDLQTFIANKYGTKVYEKHYNYSGIPYTADAKNNKYSMKYYCVEQAIARSLADYTNNVYGYTATLDTKLAKLDDVKKKTELYDFIDQVKLLSKEIEGKGVADFVKAAEKYVPFWEKMTQYSEGKKADEVKRAAYQNLAVYYILSKDADKAKAIISEYKKIDKEVKEMFGLIKYKNSDVCDTLISKLTFNLVAIDEKKAGTEILSKEIILDRLTYNTIEGTVRIKDKKHAGPHTGLIKIRNMTTTAKSSGNMLNLDASDVDMLIITKNEKGGMDTLKSYISKIEELKDNAGKKYIAQKFSNVIAFAAGSAGYYGLLMVSFESAKVNVYRCIVPTTYSDDYVVRKPSDEKGIRSGTLTDFKKLTEYLSDCPEIATQAKAGQIDRKTTPEKLAEQYANCSDAK
jgi:hypothetical protein